VVFKALLPRGDDYTVNTGVSKTLKRVVFFSFSPMAKIPVNLYQQILENMPVCCVDLVIAHDGKVLLGFRKDEPLKGAWCVPGGRILKNETFAAAVQRKAKEEVGLDVDIVRKVGSYEIFFDKGPFPLKTGVHDIAIVFLVKPKGKNPVVKLESHQSKYKWFGRIEKDFHPYVKQVLNDAKIFRS
jgi:colanic acid biosynthesis protein WcaH